MNEATIRIPFLNWNKRCWADVVEDDDVSWNDYTYLFKIEDDGITYEIYEPSDRLFFKQFGYVAIKVAD